MAQFCKRSFLIGLSPVHHSGIQASYWSDATAGGGPRCRQSPPCLHSKAWAETSLGPLLRGGAGLSGKGDFLLARLVHRTIRLVFFFGGRRSRSAGAGFGSGALELLGELQSLCLELVQSGLNGEDILFYFFWGGGN